MKLSIPRTVAALLFGAALALGAAHASAAGSAAYESGLRLYRQKDYRGAVGLLGDAVKASPTDADSALLLGLAYLRLEEAEKAAAAWGDFLKHSGNSALAGEIARLRTLVVREGNRQAAYAAIAREKTEPTQGIPGIIAVLPLHNSGGGEYEALGSAISAMLASNLAGLPTEQVVGRDRVDEFLAAVGSVDLGNEQEVARLGKLLRAAKVVVGSYVVKSSNPITLEIDSSLIDSNTGERQKGGSFLGPLDRFYVPIRDTAVVLAGEFGWPVSVLPQAASASVQAVHTKSLDAANAFGRGLDREQRADFAGARVEFEGAMRDDPTFELARRHLSTLPAEPMSLAAVANTVESQLLGGKAPPTAALLVPRS